MPLPRPSALLLLTASLYLAASPTHAEDDHEKKGISTELGSATLNFTFDAAFGGFSVTNPQFGGASNSPNGERAGKRNWFEGFVKPGLGIEQPIGDGTAYAGLSAIGSFTRGNGEAQATAGTAQQPDYFALEDAFIGWRSGATFAALGEDAVDISAGNQGFSIGDGFLIVDGTAEGWRRGAYVMGPRGAFERTAILKLNTDPVRADFFHLAGRVDQKRMRGNDSPGTQLYGANLEWFGSAHLDHGRSEYEERAWYLGATYLHIYDADTTATGGGANRDGLNVYALRAGLVPSDKFYGIGFFGEFAVQENDKTGSKVKAKAWYAEPQYTASALPWQPRLSYRFSRFSGDDNTNDTTDKSWDSLYSGGGPRGFGTWDQGEIYARYIGGNSNLRSQMIHLKLQPDEALSLGGIYYRHDFDAVPNGASSRRLMDEVNLYAQWETPLKGLNLTLVGGMGKPGDGQKQSATTNNAGNGEAVDRTIWLGQFVLGYSF
ncbi:alginate export family protein [Ferrovibrio sp.]|uniref:alginate export family protein n=1 Tax=Ferrovibrio sp. TaxID=1917215 RepID=UPI003D2C2761